MSTRQLRTAALTATVTVALVAAPWLISVYAVDLLTRALVLGLLAVSVSVVTGHAGLPTLGQVAPYAVGAYTTALLVRAGVTVGVVHLVAAALAGALFALLTSPVVVRARGVNVLMITLAIGQLTATLAGQWHAVTGGTDGLAVVDSVQPFWGAADLVSDLAVYWYVLGAVGLAVALTRLVLRSPAGLLLAGSRENELRMRASGHAVTRHLLLACVGAGALAGISGALLVTSQQFVSPADVGFDTAALVLLAVVLGGSRSLTGALVGAGLIVATRDWLSGPWPGHAPLLLGAVFVLSVYLLPDGVAGLLAKTGRPWPARARARARAAAPRETE